MATRSSRARTKEEVNTAEVKYSQATLQSELAKVSHYGSQGVTDNDIFLLPGSDLQILLGITAVAAAVRLFRIYQPSSVVFDEVQYAP